MPISQSLPEEIPAHIAANITLSHLNSFQPSFDRSQLDELKDTLLRTKLPSQTYASLAASSTPNSSSIHGKVLLGGDEHPHPSLDNYGIGYDWMKAAVDYWANDYLNPNLQSNSWDHVQAQLNRPYKEKGYGHYMTQVQDSPRTGESSTTNTASASPNTGGTTFDIQFIASWSPDPNAIPLLLLHGWPGSFLEFIPTLQILHHLQQEPDYKGPTFHIICPSQPGYGWSSGPRLDQPKYGMYDVARLLNQFMLQLGFEKGYAAQGGDIGSVLARILGAKYPSCKAVNLNYLPLLPVEESTTNSPLSSMKGLTDLEIKNCQKANEFARTGRGYGVMHGTRPSTIGFVIQSSPIALLAWLAEKFRDWTDSRTDDDLPSSPSTTNATTTTAIPSQEERPDETQTTKSALKCGGISIDSVLEVCTMWWLLETFPKSIYAYAELTKGVGPWHRDPELYLSKPFGFSSFGQEIASAPKRWAAETGNLQFYRYHDRGGHFAAFERPQDFAKDMIDCFGQIYPKV